MRCVIRIIADDNSAEPRHSERPLHYHLPLSKGRKVAVPLIHDADFRGVPTANRVWHDQYSSS
jgi:hypothetical protein